VGGRTFPNPPSSGFATFSHEYAGEGRLHRLGFDQKLWNPALARSSNRQRPSSGLCNRETDHNSKDSAKIFGEVLLNRFAFSGILIQAVVDVFDAGSYRLTIRFNSDATQERIMGDARDTAKKKKATEKKGAKGAKAAPAAKPIEAKAAKK
jgi:hypothetical protein